MCGFGILALPGQMVSTVEGFGVARIGWLVLHKHTK